MTESSDVGMNESISEPQHWIARVNPYPGESISHYLGRFRRFDLNSISSASSLSKMAGLGVLVPRWEKFRLNPPPTDEVLAQLGSLIGLEANELRSMFPPLDEPLKGTICLCAACYSEAPFHRLQWQFKSVAGCELHRLRLLSKCPSCGTPFPLPTSWTTGKCETCGMWFRRMAKHQKGYQL
jgi:hypothetical protein